jgi:hypothetical protein
MVRKISPASCQEKVSCKHFLVVKEKNRPSLDVHPWIYSVDEKYLFVDRLMLDGVCWRAAV